MVAIVGIFWLVFPERLELAVLVEDILYLLTGAEYDADEILPRSRLHTDGGMDNTVGLEAADD